MQSRQLVQGPQRTFVVVFDKGEELKEGLTSFARASRMFAARISGVGAFHSCTLGYFNRENMGYDNIELPEQVEVLSLDGDIAAKDGEPEVHAHVVVGKRDGSAWGGHLLRADVWPTLEVMLVEAPAHLRRVMDDETGLALIALDRTTSGPSREGEGDGTSAAEAHSRSVR